VVCAIFDCIADTLLPADAVALSSTCKGLRTTLKAALEVLQQRHLKAKWLCPAFLAPAAWSTRRGRMPVTSCKALRDAPDLEYFVDGLHPPDETSMAVLAMILRTSGLPRLQYLEFPYPIKMDRPSPYRFCLPTLCEDLAHGTFPALHTLQLYGHSFGRDGAVALALALGRGAMPKLVYLHIGANDIGNQGVAALAVPLRRLPVLADLRLDENGIGDEGVTSLVDNLGKDDFKALQKLHLEGNEVTDVGCARLVSVIKAGALPSIEVVEVYTESGPSDEAIDALDEAIDALDLQARDAWEAREAALEAAIDVD